MIYRNLHASSGTWRRSASYATIPSMKGNPAMNHMKHMCSCGREYAAVPREVPLSADDPVNCHSCGCLLRGRRSSRYFDYFPVDQIDANEETGETGIAPSVARRPL